MKRHHTNLMVKQSYEWSVANIFKPAVSVQQPCTCSSRFSKQQSYKSFQNELIHPDKWYKVIKTPTECSYGTAKHIWHDLNEAKSHKSDKQDYDGRNKGVWSGLSCLYQDLTRNINKLLKSLHLRWTKWVRNLERLIGKQASPL